MPFHHILLATDFSEASDAAATRARELAESVGGRLTVVTALEPLPGYYAPAMAGSPPGLLDQVRTALEAELARYVTARFPGLAGVDHRVVDGKPPDAILQAATEVNADV